jgi:hypothetical protein
LPFARQTARLAGIVRLLGHSAGGRPSERLMRRLGMPVSDTTILRSLKEHARARSDNGAVHVAGIDDWAWRKGTNYGTIIVDLERRQVVDLLADRSAATTASWFKDHPEVEVVGRDRAGLYADAARQRAPQARQVADRFHLLQNFRETVERQLGRFEAPISDSQVNARDNQAMPPFPARSDCASDAVKQKRLMCRGRQAACTHWKAPPCHGAHVKRTLQSNSRDHICPHDSSASSNALASFRSRVSKPSVNRL